LAYVEDYSACREAIGGVAAHIETGFISGGFGGFKHVRAVHAVWWTSWRGPLLDFDGHPADADNQRELIAVVRSVRFHKLPSHR
jgi:hypothetical protein